MKKITQFMMMQSKFFTLLVAILILSTAACVNTATIVESLPGFSGDLPFKLQTGYIGVGKREEVQLFYYFIESEGNPEADPLMLWLTGGPGCTTLSSFFYEHLGLYFNRTTTTWETELPPLQLNPYSWTKFVSMIFLDSPVGTGFSYAKTAESNHTTDVVAAQQIYEFLQKWLTIYPKFATNPFYVGASSYSGMMAPIVAQEIINGNDDELEPQVNFKGYVLGSPLTDPQGADRIGNFEFIHRVSILSDELYELTKVSCSGLNGNESSLECEKYMQYEAYLLESIFPKHILESNMKASNPNNWCQDFNKLIIDNWVNNVLVRKALHVREGTVGDWTRCSPSLRSYEIFNRTILSTVAYHQNLTKTPLRALIYSGDQDLLVSSVGTMRWIKKLNAQISNNWRPWFVNDQVIGYVTEYSKGHYNLTFTTIKGAGHCATGYYPRESFTMLQNWLATNPL